MQTQEYKKRISRTPFSNPYSKKKKFQVSISVKLEIAIFKIY